MEISQSALGATLTNVTKDSFVQLLDFGPLTVKRGIDWAEIWIGRDCFSNAENVCDQGKGHHRLKLNVANPRPHCPGGVITLHSDLPPCAGCGRCCHLVVALRATDQVPEEFVVEHDGVRCLEQRSNGACVALDHATQLCTIYESRPQTCRDFNRGENLCRRILSQSRR